MVAKTNLNASTSKSWAERLTPALLVLFLGWSVLLLRGPMPLDETRYAEVFREMLSGSKLVLTLNSEGYSHKTPLLFWFAWLAHSLGLSLGASLMVWPAIFSSFTVLFVGRLGERFGLRHADWIVAGMVMPLVFSGVVLFDAMLCVFVWFFLWARSEDRRGLAMLASIPMMMAKGPAALVFALPYGIALKPNKGRSTWNANLFVQLLPGIAVLGLWAGTAILKAGDSSAEGGQFAANLAWNQTAGRVFKSFAHARPIYWYIPIILVAALPYSGALLTPLRRIKKSALGDPTLRKLVLASLGVFLIWSLISGKQPHYLMPMLPALAILFAADFQERPRLLRRASLLAAGFLGLLFTILLVIRFGWISDPLDGYGDRAVMLRSSVRWNFLLFGGAGVALCSALFIAFRKPALPQLCATFAVGFFALMAPMHGGLHNLSLPKTMVVQPFANQLIGRPMATIGNQQAGLYNLYFKADYIIRLSPGNPKSIETWCQSNPTGAIFVEEKNIAILTGMPLKPLVRDRIRGKHNWALLVTPGQSFDPTEILKMGPE